MTARGVAGPPDPEDAAEEAPVSPEEQAVVAAYDAGYTAGRVSGLRDGRTSAQAEAAMFGPVRAVDLFPLALDDPEHFLMRCALIKEEHRINQARGRSRRAR